MSKLVAAAQAAIASVVGGRRLPAIDIRLGTGIGRPGSSMFQ